MKLVCVAIAALLCGWTGFAAAQESQWEVRGGAAISGIELSTTFTPKLSTFNAGNLDMLQLDVLYAPPDMEFLEWLGSPRFEVGGLLNLRGRESLVHGGLTWHWGLFDTPVFVELGVGAAVHNGSVTAAPPLRNLGCNFAFHYTYSVGTDIGKDWTLVAKFQHISHGGVCGPSAVNDGINNFGVVVGHKF